ncbi:MAG TPA: hypothetical protein VGE74_04875 [Gemmata sp.]
MSRFASAALFVCTVALANSARAELPVAPAPREVRPDGSRDPAPKAEPPVTGENPAVTVERIIKNSKEVGNKLEMKDTGTDTRKTQTKILSDIDALINQQENPPPPKPDQDNKDNKQDNKDNKDDKKDNKDNKQDNKDDKQDNKGMGMPMSKTDMGMDTMPMPKDGMGMGGMGESQPMGRRPRMNDPMNGSPKEPNGAKEPSKPDTEKKTGQPKNTKSSSGSGMGGGSNPMGKVSGKPILPFEEEDASKDVWGHLPDRLRRQMSQYYKDEFTPKYAELLKLYYSSLADKNAKPGEPKK